MIIHLKKMNEGGTGYGHYSMAGSARAFGEFDRLRREMNRSLNEVLTGDGTFFSRAYPAVNITEDGENFYVRGELPGVKPEDLEVAVVDGRLLIRGERKLGTEEKSANYHRREREGGFFRRIIALPARVNSEKVVARVKNGSLRLPCPSPKKPNPVRLP